MTNRISKALFVLVLGSGVAYPQLPQQSATPRPGARQFAVSLPARTVVKSAGELRAGGIVVNLETFSALCLEPSTTATFEVAGPETRSLTKASTRNHLVIHDQKPALKENPNKEPFFTRAEGAISAFTWIEGAFTDALISGDVNTDGGPGGGGSYSRQGLMARWDQGNNFYWFYVDFASGEYAIMRSRFFGVMEKLADAQGNSSWKLPAFSNKKSYFLEFELKGATVKGRVFEHTIGGEKGELLVETPSLVDKDPFASGLSGFLAETSLSKPFEPLHASFGTLASVEN